MNVSTFTLIISITFGFLFVVLLIVAFLKRHDIINFFSPEKYNMVFMLEKDNNINSWLQKKNPELTFTFNKGTYNMYNPEDKTDYSQYRQGRNQAFLYIEGTEFPIDFKFKSDLDFSKLRENFIATNLSDLFTEEDSGFMQFIKKYGIFILIGLGVIIFGMMLLSGNNAGQTPIQPPKV